jgi:hypothetical protein
MEDLSKMTAPAPAKTKPRVEDHSREIERAVAREPLDRVKCVKLYDDKYRCNWWAPMAAHPATNRAFDWSTLSTHHVRRSVFLTVRIAEDKLVIVESERR